MLKHLLATAALLPAVALAGVLPAQAGTGDATSTTDRKVTAQEVDVAYGPNAAPLRALRSSTQSCTGTLVSKQLLIRSGVLMGELDVYYKPANGGTAIACFRHAGTTVNKRMPTSVVLRAAHSTRAIRPEVVVNAYGRFSSYAGPAAIGGVNGRCVDAIGGLAPGRTLFAVTTPAICFR